MERRAATEGAVWSWLIGLAALALLVWAVVEFARTEAGPDPALARVAGNLSPAPAEEAVELFRLLPDATDDLGTPVRLDGVVVSAVAGQGVWVRDLRDNTVFVSRPRGVGAPAGAPVEVAGRLELLAPDEAAALVRAASPPLAEGLLLVRDVRLLPLPAGFRVLAE